MTLQRAVFDENDLRGIGQSRHVVLASGGPLLTVVGVEDGQAVVVWLNGDRKVERAVLPITMLRKLVPVTVAEAKEAVR